MSTGDDVRPAGEFPGMKLNEAPGGGRWWALGADTVKDFPLGDYIPAAWLDELQADYDALRAEVERLKKLSIVLGRDVSHTANELNGQRCRPASAEEDRDHWVRKCHGYLDLASDLQSRAEAAEAKVASHDEFRRRISIAVDMLNEEPNPNTYRTAYRKLLAALNEGDGE